jgi:DNA-binding transcriptional LysR family regulator
LALPRLDLADLRAFCIVVDHGSVTAAARVLGETKGAVSRRLSRLEKSVGAALLLRSPRQVAASPDGLAFRKRVGTALDSLDDAASLARDTSGAPVGRLRITAPHDFGAAVLGPLLHGFSSRFPGIRVEALLSERVLDLEAHQLDVAFRIATSTAGLDLVSHKVLEIKLGLYASPAFLAEHGAPANGEDLAAHRLLVFGSEAGPFPWTLLRPGGQPVDVRGEPGLFSTSSSLIREAALADGGIALLPGFLAARDLEAGRLERVLPRYSIRETGGVFLLHRPGGVVPAKVAAFRDYVVAQLAPARKRVRAD